LRSFLEGMQLTPPGSPFPHEPTDETSATFSSAAKAEYVDKSPSPIPAMTNALIGSILPRPRTAAQTPKGRSTLGCTGSTWRERSALYRMGKVRCLAPKKKLAEWDSAITQHQALNLARLAGLLVAIDDYGAQANVSGRRLEAH